MEQEAARPKIDLLGQEWMELVRKNNVCALNQSLMASLVYCEA